MSLTVVREKAVENARNGDTGKNSEKKEYLGTNFA